MTFSLTSSTVAPSTSLSLFTSVSRPFPCVTCPAPASICRYAAATSPAALPGTSPYPSSSAASASPCRSIAALSGTSLSPALFTSPSLFTSLFLSFSPSLFLSQAAPWLISVRRATSPPYQFP